MVTIREVGKRLAVSHGHVVHQIGNKRLAQRLPVHGMPTIGAESTLDRRYGHVVHT